MSVVGQCICLELWAIPVPQSAITILGRASLEARCRVSGRERNCRSTVFLRFFAASVHPTPIRNLQRMSELRTRTQNWKYDRPERELR